MGERLRDSDIRKLPLPATGHKIHWDESPGLGVRVTAAGAKSFILDYRNRSGRQRRLTIGACGDWTITAARLEARDLRQQIDSGGDPISERQADRSAPTVADLCQRFKDEHLPKKRPRTRRDYEALIDNYILPALSNHKVTEVTFSDIDSLHRKITKSGATYQANRAVAVLSKAFNLAIKWGMRTDNPAKGVERNHEDRRERYLSEDELTRLGKALAKHDDQEAVAIIRLLLLTGARSGEVKSMRWADLDLKAGVWSKAASTTKQRKSHRVPLSEPAVNLLKALRMSADRGAEYVFPGRLDGHRKEFKRDWADICKAANIRGARIHDMRHTYASILASSGLGLPVIGGLLGHSQPATTARYSHLIDDALRAATEKAGAFLNGK
jgi:integrase